MPLIVKNCNTFTDIKNCSEINGCGVVAALLPLCCLEMSEQDVSGILRKDFMTEPSREGGDAYWSEMHCWNAPHHESFLSRSVNVNS